MSWKQVGVEITLQLLPIIAVLIAGLIGLGLAYLKKKMDLVKNKTMRESINNAIAETEKVAKDAVMGVQQTFVEDIKKKREDGKLTKQEAMQALNKSKNYFMKNLSKDTVQVIESSIGPIQEYAENLIESKLAEFKREDKSKIEAELNKLANPKLKGLTSEEQPLDLPTKESG